MPGMGFAPNAVLRTMNRIRLIVSVLISVGAVCHAESWSVDAGKLVTSARSQIGVTIKYDSSYQKIDYPGGDVPREKGVCSDVVVRSLREQGIDLQKEVHEDMAAHFSKYPQRWKLGKPDTNIDHRRVLNLMTFFQRRGCEMEISRLGGSYRAGDIVAWDLGGGVTHIGVISDRTIKKGVPLVIHNIGRGVQEEDILFQYEIIGHYRNKGTK
jgi:uncharacterized protein YijF (DUF1287 family)